jgi:flagellar assembly protein FliH
MASLDGVPHLVIRCHPDLAEAVREIATGRMATSGFSGRLVVMGDPDQALGDGRLEWVDGGLVRDVAAISAEIDRRIAAFLATRHIRTGAASAQENEL